jgi:hypothetical protein
MPSERRIRSLLPEYIHIHTEISPSTINTTLFFVQTNRIWILKAAPEVPPLQAPLLDKNSKFPCLTVAVDSKNSPKCACRCHASVVAVAAVVVVVVL